HHPLGHRRAEAPVPAEDPQRGRDLGPGLLPARGRLRPGDASHARRAPAARRGQCLVHGRKVGASGPQYADSIILLVRTAPSVPKHNGISCLLVDLRSPGVSVRPLVLATGHHHFNEVFFTDVEVPKSRLLGPINQGWKVSTTQLRYKA